MPRDVYRNTAPRTETPKARQAFADYAAMPAGERSLTRLLEKYRTSTEHPPTRNLSRLKFWSQVWGWQQRLAVQQAEQEYARKQEMQRQIEAQAREDAKLLHGVGSGALGVAALLLSQLVDARTGQLKGSLGTRDLGVLARVGIECLAAARGESPEGTDPNAHIHRVLREAPEDVRATVVRGLRAFTEFCEQHEGRR